MIYVQNYSHQNVVIYGLLKILKQMEFLVNHKLTRHDTNNQIQFQGK